MTLSKWFLPSFIGFKYNDCELTIKSQMAKRFRVFTVVCYGTLLLDLTTSLHPISTLCSARVHHIIFHVRTRRAMRVSQNALRKQLMIVKKYTTDEHRLTHR